MKPRFRLPMSAEQAYNCLLAAVMAEVEFRHRNFYETEDAKAQLRQMANWITSESSKFGILLCGECGNGKSTLLKAFQQLLNFLAVFEPEIATFASDDDLTFRGSASGVDALDYDFDNIEEVDKVQIMSYLASLTTVVFSAEQLAACSLAVNAKD